MTNLSLPFAPSEHVGRGPCGGGGGVPKVLIRSMGSLRAVKVKVFESFYILSINKATSRPDGSVQNMVPTFLD